LEDTFINPFINHPLKGRGVAGRYHRCQPSISTE